MVLKARDASEASDSISTTKITGGVAVVSNSALIGFIECAPKKMYTLLREISAAPEIGPIRVVSR